MAVPCRPLVALLLLMVIAGPVQAVDSEFHASKSQLPRKVQLAGDLAGLPAKVMSGFSKVASILGSYLNLLGRHLADLRLTPDLVRIVLTTGPAQSGDIAGYVGIHAMPTFIAFKKNGETFGKVIGADPRKLTELIDQLADS